MNEQGIVPIEPISKTPIPIMKPDYSKLFDVPPLQMGKQKHYVCGFLFDLPWENVQLVLKNRGPACNIGRWNGIGGRVELGEGIRAAQAREMNEEAGIYTDPTDWECFHLERFQNLDGSYDTIHFMVANLAGHRFWEFATLTDEEIRIHTTRQAASNTSEYAYNLCYLIPMAISWMTVQRNIAADPVNTKFRRYVEG